MQMMFYYCNNIKSLDLTNFNTSSVTNMKYMFYHCESLVSIDLSCFDTSKVKYMNSMFGYCSSLISLNLNNFDTSNVTNMNSMFWYCSSLVSLNLNNFNTEKEGVIVSDMFNFCKVNLIVCLNTTKASKIASQSYFLFKDKHSIIGSKLNNISCEAICYKSNYYYYCFEDECPIEYSKLLFGKKTCINNCTNDIDYQYEYLNICYKKCPKRTKNNNYICQYLNCTYYNEEENDCTTNLKEIIKKK